MTTEVFIIVGVDVLVAVTLGVLVFVGTGVLVVVGLRVFVLLGVNVLVAVFLGVFVTFGTCVPSALTEDRFNISGKYILFDVGRSDAICAEDRSGKLAGFGLIDKYPFFAWESPNEINWKLTAASRLEATREYLVNSVASGILVPLVI
ncbi:MAG TPA: hypothetical protein VIJ25_19725 [Methylococcales bacterium]